MGINEDLELKLIKEIEDRQKRIEEREEELLENVQSFDECFEENFFKEAKSVEVGDKRLYRYIVDEILLNNYPVAGVLENKVNVNNVLEDVLSIVKSADSKKYATLSKYKNNISVKFKYQSVFLLNVKCEGYVSRIVAKYLGKHSGFRAIPYSDTISKEVSLILDMPKGKLDMENLSKCNYTNLLNTDILPPKTTKTAYDLYKRIKKEITKLMKVQLKASHGGTNYCLRDIEFENMSLKQVLVPTYLIRCADPGIDTKCVINASNRTCM